jgi:O-Antigen ligase
MTSAESIRADARTGSNPDQARRRLADPGLLIAFGLPAAAVVIYALRGGSYDIVVRQELGVAVWWVLLIGLVSGVLPRATPPRVAVLPAVGLVALAAVTALGLTFSESDERTVDELARVLHYGGVVALAVSLVDARTWKYAAAGLTTGAVLVSLLALGSRLFPDLFPADTVKQVFPSSRQQYPLSYWNGVAAFTAMTAILALGLSAHGRSRAGRALALASVPSVIAVTYVTYSRGGIVAVAVGLIALLILVPHRALLALHAVVAAAAGAVVILVIRGQAEIARGTGTDGAALVLVVCVAAALVCAAAVLATSALNVEGRLRVPSRPARVVATGTGVVVLALAVIIGPGLVDSGVDRLRVPPPADRPADPAARLTTLGSARYEVWRTALDVHAAEPLHGTGPGTFEFAWNRSPRYDHFVRDAHSFYLESLAEEGWLGLGAGLLFLGGLLWAGTSLRVRVRRDPVDAGYLGALLAAFVVYLAYAGYDWMWELTAVSVFALIAVSIAIASAGRIRGGGLGWPARLALGLVALIVGLTQLPGMVSTAKIRSSQQAVRDGDYSTAMADAEDAVASAPWAATPYIHRGLLLERAGRLADARADILRAIQREPTNYRHPLLLARIEAQRGRVRAALVAFRSARRLAPKKVIEAGGPKPFASTGGP